MSTNAPNHTGAEQSSNQDDDIREQTENKLREACEVDETQGVVIEAPPASGKTTGAVKLAEETEYKISYLAARRDMCEQAEEQISELDSVSESDYLRIKSSHESCEIMKSDQYTQLQSRVRQGEGLRSIHFSDSNLPDECQYDGSRYQCEYMKNRKLLDDNEYDILIGTHQHAYIDSVTDGRIVIFDEYPENLLNQYTYNGSNMDPHDMITNYISSIDNEFPLDENIDMTDLIKLRALQNNKYEKLRNWVHNDAPAPDEAAEDNDQAQPSRHSKFALQRLLEAEPVADGSKVEFSKVDQTESTQEKRFVRNRNSGNIWVVDPPDLTDAEQVIGLDAIPVKELWQAILGLEFTRECVFDTGHKDSDRIQLGIYIDQQYALDVYQPENNRRNYYTRKRNVEPSKDYVLFEQARNERLSQSKFPLITSKAAIDVYKEHGLLDTFIEEIEGDNSAYADDNYRILNYGSVTSSNVFKEDKEGIVSGIIYPGHQVVKMWTALCNEPATPEDNSGNFDGFEQDLADKVFKFQVHHRVVQSMLRFGRTEEIDTANVYVNTTVIPSWLERQSKTIEKRRPLDKPTQGKLFAAIAALFYSHDDKSFTAPEIAEKIHPALPNNTDKKKSFKVMVTRKLSKKFHAKYGIVERDDTGEPHEYSLSDQAETRSRESIEDETRRIIVFDNLPYTENVLDEELDVGLVDIEVRTNWLNDSWIPPAA